MRIHNLILSLLFIMQMIVGGSTALCDQNLLKNPSFEKITAVDMPTHWNRKANPLLSSPLQLSTEAAEGRHSVLLTTEEWNFLRPQLITQKVKLPSTSRSLGLTVMAKGIGLISLRLEFEREGKPLAVTPVDLGFGLVNLPVEERRAYALTPSWRLYDINVSVPKGADAVVVKLGNTIGPLARLNTWGRVWFDKVVLTSSRQPIAEVSAIKLSDTPSPSPSGCRDVLGMCQVISTPPAFGLAKLSDQNPKTAPAFMAGFERGGTYDVVFASPLAATRIDIALNGNVRLLDVWGDTDGDGLPETCLATIGPVAGTGWVSIDLPKTPVHRLRLLPIAGKLWDFRQSNRWCGECRVYVKKELVAKAGQAVTGSFGTRPEAPMPENWLKLTPATLPIPPVEKHRFQRMMCADLWMWGIDASKQDSALPQDISSSVVFQRTVKKLHQMGVDAVLIDLTNSSVWNLMPWPSKVGRGTHANFLKPLITAIHAQGFKVYVELIHNISPFETIKWHYPEEETSRYPEMNQYPSIVHGNHVRDNWLALLQEIMACGADGVGASSDEQYYRGAFLETLPANDPGREIYRKRFGHDVPSHEEDTLAYRQWIKLRHEGIGDLFGYWTQRLRQRYPNIYTNTMLMQWTSSFSYLEGSGIPIDVLGSRSGITEIGSDYMDSYGVAMAAAANGWRRATMLHEGNYSARLPDVHFYATTLWCWMYGASSTNYWRFNFVVDKGSDGVVGRVYAMSHDLEALGAFEARPPHRIAMLSSRASVDWWQVRAWWGSHSDPMYNRGNEGLRGWYADMQTFYTFQKNGYPIDCYFLDNPDHLKKLGGYDVLVLPFAYSLSREAIEAIKAAAAGGTTVVLVDGRQGETDAMGERFEQPALAGLVASGKAVLLRRDILAWGDTPAFGNDLLGAVNKALGNRRPLTLVRQGNKIDATVLENKKGDRFVFLVNWEEKPVNPGVGISLPDGQYEVFARDDKQWYQGRMAGRITLNAADLSRFRMKLASQKPCILYIRPQKP